jgi:serine protease inhibitor
MISGLHYKGEWKNKFNKTDTFNSKFYDSNGKSNGNVDMMFQRSPIAYSTIKDIGSYVIEMEYADPPLASRLGEYGKGLSMFVILPKKGQSLAKTAKDVYQYTMNNIYRDLYLSKVNYGDEEVEVYVPKFEAVTDLDIKTSLEKVCLTHEFFKF